MRLFEANRRLIGVNDQAIVEILDGGKNNRVLASARRRPAVSVLDTMEGFGKPNVFSGAGHSIRAFIQNKIFTWAGQDWTELASPGQIQSPEIFANEIILWGAFNEERIWRLANDKTNAELCWFQTNNSPGFGGNNFSPGRLRRVGATATNMIQPRWKNDSNMLLGPNVAADGENLYFLRSSATGRNSRTSQTIDSNFQLVCLLRDEPKPILISLKFAALKTKTPAFINRAPYAEDHPNWMLFTENALAFSMPVYSPMENKQAGFWLIPRSELESAIAAQKK